MKKILFVLAALVILLSVVLTACGEKTSHVEQFLPTSTPTPFPFIPPIIITPTPFQILPTPTPLITPLLISNSLPGTKIAFVSNRDGNEEIYLMDVDGKNQINLTKNPADDWDPAISPDGTKIAFVSNRDGDAEIYIINVDGTNLVQLTFNNVDDKDPAWFPENSRIVFSEKVKTHDYIFDTQANWEDEIFIMNADGGGQRQLINPTEVSTDYPLREYNNNQPAVSPDGKKIAFSVEDNRGGHPPVIYIMNSDGTNPSRFIGKYYSFESPPQTSSHYENPSWSKDNKKILFNDDFYSGVCLENIDKTDFKRIYSVGGEPCFSPDESKIAFVKGDFVGLILGIENRDIYIMNLDGSAVTRLTYGGNGVENWSPSWGSTPKKIVPEGPILVLEQQLAEKFSPILYLHPEEVYEPKDVRIMIENSDLRRKPEMTKAIAVSPLTATYLYNLPNSENYYLDLWQILGSGADGYAKRYNEIKDNYLTTVYARVTIIEGKTVIQYWLFYFFNDGPINNHEGDWEAIQLVFDGTDYGSILVSGAPESITYSKHTDKEALNWTQVFAVQNHPSVYVAKGSHANYPNVVNWISGSEFLDETSSEGNILIFQNTDIVQAYQKSFKDRVKLYQLVMLPELSEVVAAKEQVPWLTFKGGWGEWLAEPNQLFNAKIISGPEGPIVHRAWIDPLR